MRAFSTTLARAKHSRPQVLLLRSACGSHGVPSFSPFPSRRAMTSDSVFPRQVAVQWPDYAGMKAEALESRNPATGALIKEWGEMGEEDVHHLLAELFAFFQATFRRTSVAQRCELVREIGEGLRASADTLAELVHQEMGKAVGEAKAEVLKSAGLCDWYAANGAKILNNGDPVEVTPPIPNSRRSFFVYEPLGVILSVMPWNFPVWQVVRQLVPCLVGGNVVVLKHAPNVMGCGVAVEEIVTKAAQKVLPGGTVFRSLTVSTRQIEPILAHPGVRGVSLTGSERAGRSVAALAGAHLKKCVVELGGNDGYVILPSANLEAVAEKVVGARLLNMGQSCIGPKRVIVVGAERCEALCEKLVQKLQTKEAEKGGPGNFAPLVHSAAKKEVALKVQAALDHGATLLHGDAAGGAAPDSAFYNPVVIRGIERASPSFDTEIFGPVFSVLQAESEAEAVALHNASSFGLGGAVFGDADAEEPHLLRLAHKELDTGMCAVNDFVRSDPSLPFGGIRNSGLGRECGAHGVLEFVNVKSVCMG